MSALSKREDEIGRLAEIICASENRFACRDAL